LGASRKLTKSNRGNLEKLQKKDFSQNIGNNQYGNKYPIDVSLACIKMAIIDKKMAVLTNF